MKALYGPLIGALWIGWLIYWQIAAHNVKAARRQESRLSRATHILPLLLATALLVYPETSGGWVFAQFMPRTIVTYWLGVGLLGAGLGFSILARRYLGRNWSGTVTLKEDHELIRTGPYRWVRHPIYSGILLGFVGSAVALGGGARRMARIGGGRTRHHRLPAEDQVRGTLDDRDLRRGLSALSPRGQGADPVRAVNAIKPTG
jgi:protein-S-isoprenylcysteine O-methyltransferase Ste14